MLIIILLPHPPLMPTRNLGILHVKVTFYKLIESSTDNTFHSRIMVATMKESGACVMLSLVWSSFGWDSMRTSHICQQCGVVVDHLGTHGLSCRKNHGHYSRHAPINDKVKRSLTVAKIPSHLWEMLRWCYSIPMEQWAV